MENKRALITGITGQDGYYLANFLLNKGYEVYGMYRKNVLDINDRIPDLDPRIKLMEGDLRDSSSLISVIQRCQPHEIYNLAAQSFLSTSWEEPELSCDVNGTGVLRLLEAIRITNPKIKFYQASSREICGKPNEHYVNEKTPVNPINLYASAKAFAQSVISSYREKYGLYLSTGIAFNHESPRRGKEFITRKITDAVARIKFGLWDSISVGNLNSKRDWGYSGDFVEAMWLILQQEKPDDYVLATGEAHTVRELLEEAFKIAGMFIVWEGEGLKEIGKCNEKIVVRINEKFYRPNDEELIFGDINKAKNKLGWMPKTDFKNLIKMMVESDLKKVGGEILLKQIQK